jgi:hypothetical protein
LAKVSAMLGRCFVVMASTMVCWCVTALGPWITPLAVVRLGFPSALRAFFRRLGKRTP